MSSLRGAALALSITVLILIPLSAFAVTTHTVRQDGSGDFTTIGAAVAASVAGDIIEVGPGVYAELVDVFHPLTFISTDGAAATIMDGETTHYPLWFRAGTGHVVDGFTFRRGYHTSGGGAIRCQGGATLTIRNSIMEDNVSGFDGGAFFTRDTGSFIEAQDCVFRRNRTERNGGASIAILNSTMRFINCTFIDNAGTLGAGATAVDHSRLDVIGCLYVNNTATTAGAVYAYVSTGEIRSNTFYGSSSELWASVLIQESEGMSVERNIFYGEELTVALAFLPYYGDPHGCNVYFNNELGSIWGTVLNASEVELDPVFCDAAAGDFTISLQSPAAPAHSACGQLIGARPTACDIAPPPPPPPPVIEPVILTIDDVPDDQGFQVRIRWERADYDAPNQPYTITGYGLYRLQAGATAALPPASLVTPPGERRPDIDGWDYIATIPARGDDVYQYVAPTLCNTRQNSDPCWSVFFVSAMTPNPLVYFDSVPDSGYSVDNLPPGPPGALVVQATAGGNSLAWEPSDAPDVAAYQIYRATAALAAPDAELLVHTTAGTEWTDEAGGAGTTYTVFAVDKNGNVSEGTSQGTATGAGGIPSRTYLAQNAPNPFNPSTQIEFGTVRGGERVHLEIFDVAGRLVRTLLDEPRDAGVWRVTWDGRADSGARVSSGVYFYRLRVGADVHTRRMTLLE